MFESPRQDRRRQGGFTLIELLVVVSIIALLIAMLIPSLSHARKQAKGVTCASNMRSLMLAIHLYADENRGGFPTSGLSEGGQADETRTWVNQLAESYGKKPQIARCPMDESPYWTKPFSENRFRRTSYAANSYMAFVIGGRDPYERMERIRNPSATIYWVELAETGRFAVADHVHPENWWFGDSRELAAREMALDRHLSRANYAMVDGHAESMVFEQTYAIDPDGGFPPKFLRNKYDPAIAH